MTEIDHDASTGRMYDIWINLMRTRMVMFNNRENKLKELDITAMQAAILALLHNKNVPVYPRDIAKHLYRKPNTISSYLKRLVNKGFIVLKTDEKNRSKVQIWITKKGEEIYEKSLDHEFFEEAMSPLSDEELTVFNENIMRLHKHNTAISKSKKH